MLVCANSAIAQVEVPGETGHSESPPSITDYAHHDHTLYLLSKFHHRYASSSLLSLRYSLQEILRVNTLSHKVEASPTSTYLFSLFSGSR